MILHGGRSIARFPHLGAQCLRASRGSYQLERVPAFCNLLPSPNSTPEVLSIPSSTSFQIRCLATKPASRPKAHTGTAPARKPRAAIAKEPGSTPAKTTGTRGRPKKGTQARLKAKSTTKKSKAKKPKAKPKRKVLTEKQKTATAAKITRDKVKALKKTALEPPRPGSTTAWTVFYTEQTKGIKANVSNSAKAASETYKQLSPERREHYNHLANQNKAKHERDYKTFITSHTPLEINNANKARRHLQRLLSNPKKPQRSSKYSPLKDERQVTGRRNAYSFFLAERQISGDYAGMTVATRGQLMGREWKELSVAEKKRFADKASADAERHRQEVKTVLGKDVNAKTAKASA